MIDESVAIYGAGNFGRWVVETLTRLGHRVPTILDRNFDNHRDTSVSDPKEWIPDTRQLVLALFSPGPDLRALVRQYPKFESLELITAPSLFRYLRGKGIETSRYWLSSDRLAPVRNDQTRQVLANIVDERSMELASSWLRFSEFGGLDSLVDPSPLHDQYCGPNGEYLPDSGVILDCGAYVGDSLSAWARNRSSNLRIVAFEPNSDAFRQLSKRAATARNETITLPLGVTDESGQFTVLGSGVSSRLTKDPQGSVHGCALDDVVQGLPVSFIKMDIEGGELDALRGAFTTIKRWRPTLAISVYHRPEDLLTIPLWVHRQFPGYEISLECYAHQYFESVMYARAR